MNDSHYYHDMFMANGCGFTGRPAFIAFLDTPFDSEDMTDDDNRGLLVQRPRWQPTYEVREESWMPEV
jgi:hypothetical protein